MIPSGILLFGLDAALFGGVALEQVRGDVAQDVEVFRGVTGPHTGLVFAKGDIEAPMERVFDRPVPACRPGVGARVRCDAAQVEGHFPCRLPADLPDALDHADAARPLPFRAIPEPVDISAVIQ